MRISNHAIAERLLFACITAAALLVLLQSAPLVLSPYQLDYGEGLMLDGAMRIREAQPLYPNPFNFPVVLHVYGPLAYSATELFLPHGGPSFRAGRILIVICALFLSALISFILRRITGSWWIGLSFGLLLLSLPTFRFWLYLLRADLIGIVFALAGVAVYVFNDKRWPWTIPLFGLALFAKYSLLAGPAAVFAHLILRRRLKHAALFAGGLGGAVGIVFLATELKTQAWFAFHMFSTHPDRYSLAQFFALGAIVWGSAPVVSALASWYAAIDLRDAQRSFAPLYLAASVLSSLTAGKLGSTTNHFIESMVACCICAGLGYSLLQAKFPAKTWLVTTLLGASVLAAACVQNRSGAQALNELAECGSVYRSIRDTRSTSILSESLGPLLLAGKAVLVSDPFVYGQLIGHGLWPNREVEESINRQGFGMIVMSYDPSDPSDPSAHRSDVWPKVLQDAIAQNYRVASRNVCRDAGVILEPRSSE